MSRMSADVLTEQYELFLKFNHDQLRRKFGDEMSDCSCEFSVNVIFKSN